MKLGKKKPGTVVDEWLDDTRRPSVNGPHKKLGKKGKRKKKRKTAKEIDDTSGGEREKLGKTR